MKDRLRTMLALSVLLMAPAGLTAQAPSGGIGFGLSRGGPSIVPPVNVYVPFTFGPIRVEPSLGYLWTENEEQTNHQFETHPRRYVHMHRAVSIGSGVFLSMYELGGSYTYVGPRIKYIYSRHRIKNDRQPTLKIDLDGIQVDGVLGAEYLLGTAFTLGGEVRLSYLGVQGPMDTPDPRTDAVQVRRSMGTEAVILIRWYFL